jgi:CRISPR system Cascade subunit CasA
MTMNLTTDPWIPALCRNGRRELFSLQDLFAQAGELRDLSVKPHERIALMRLLICIAQAALDGPADEAQWEQCRPVIQPRVREYLAKWKAAFELFGSGSRFLQFANLKPGRESDDGNPATKLDLALSTGNNATLFDNSAGEDRALQSSRAACNLLVFQCFSPGGRIGVARWNGAETSGNGSSNHAPCTPSSMVHTLILGDNLLSSMHLNLLTKETVADVYGPNHWGEPIWEHPVSHAGDSVSVRNATLSYLGRLVPMSRAVELQSCGAYILLANGLDYPAFPAFREATATIMKRKEELALLPASTSRGLWRQLASVSIKRRSNAITASGPLALDRNTPSCDTTIWVGALVTDKAKIEDVLESTYSLPSAMFTDLGRAGYESGVAHAEEREGVLLQSLKCYAASLKTPPAYDRARQRYWTGVEQSLSLLFDVARNPDLAADVAACDWGKAVEQAAREAYERSCPRQSPRQIQAYALGLRKLSFRPKPTNPT